MTNQQLITYFLRGVSALVIFLNSIFITNLLGSVESGYYFLTLNIVMILSVIANYGLNTYCLKQASLTRNLTVISSIVRASEKKIFLLSVILSFVLIFASKLIAEAYALPKLQSIIVIMSFSIFFAATVYVYASTFQGLGRQSVTVVIGNLLVPLNMILFMSLAFFLQGNIAVTDIAFYFLFSNIFTFFVATLFFRSEHPIKAGESHKIGKTYSFWSINILSVLLLHGTLAIMGFFLELDDYSKLSVVVRIINIFSIIHASIMLFYTPAFCEMYDDGKFKELRKKLTEAIRMLLIVSTPLVLIIAIFSSDFMGIFGDDFRSGSWMLSIVIVSPLINCFFLPITMMLTVTGYEKNVNTNMFASVIFCLFLGSVVTKFLGIYGAVVILAAVFCLHNIICGVTYLKFRLSKNESI